MISDRCYNGSKSTIFIHLAGFVPLTDATQSSIEADNRCPSNACTADLVIDGNTVDDWPTMGVTNRDEPRSWWSAKMTKEATIDRILVYAHIWAHGQGYYNKFKVETRMTDTGPWTVCKGEYSMGDPIDPHYVICDQQTTAQYIKVSIGGNKHLYLREVQVIEKTTTGKFS